MASGQYGSAEFYKVLVAIEVKINRLPCRGKHIDEGRAAKDLYDYLHTEMTACAVRAAKTKANRMSLRRRAERRGEGGD